MADTRPLRDTAKDPQTITQLRRRRVGFDEIAGHLGLPREHVVILYRQLLEQVTSLTPGELKSEEFTLADDAIRDLLTIARDHETPLVSVAAWTAIRGWAEHKARLAGLTGRPAQSEPSANRIHALRAARGA